MACACLCCGYPNGIWQVIVMQTILFFGWAFSCIAIFNCRFAEVSLVSNPDFEGGGIGFLAFEKPNGRCSWEAFSNNSDLRKEYEDFLGSDWQTARVFAFLGFFFGLILWLWSLFFICIPHPRQLRIILALWLMLLVIFQSLTFLPLGSGWCDENQCSFGRDAGFSAGAAVCYFLAAVFFLFMKDWNPRKLPSTGPFGSTTFGDDNGYASPKSTQSPRAVTSEYNSVYVDERKHVTDIKEEDGEDNFETSIAAPEQKFDIKSFFSSG